MPATRAKKKSPATRATVKTIFSNKNGITEAEFFRLYGDQVAGEDIIYAYKNNHKSDANNIKVGKSYDGKKRLKSHTHTLGVTNKNDSSSGLRIYHVEKLQKRGKDTQGTKLVDEREKSVKRALKSKTVKGRGSEIFKAGYGDVVKALKEAPIKPSYKPVRQIERRANCKLVCKE